MTQYTTWNSREGDVPEGFDYVIKIQGAGGAIVGTITTTVVPDAYGPRMDSFYWTAFAGGHTSLGHWSTLVDAIAEIILAHDPSRSVDEARTLAARSYGVYPPAGITHEEARGSKFAPDLVRTPLQDPFSDVAASDDAAGIRTGITANPYNRPAPLDAPAGALIVALRAAPEGDVLWTQEGDAWWIARNAPMDVLLRAGDLLGIQYLDSYSQIALADEVTKAARESAAAGTVGERELNAASAGICTVTGWFTTNAGPSLHYTLEGPNGQVLDYWRMPDGTAGAQIKAGNQWLDLGEQDPRYQPVMIAVREHEATRPDFARYNNPRTAIGDHASPAVGELRHFRDTSALYADHSTWYTLHSQAAYEGMIRASREHGNQVAAGEKFDLSRLPAEARALHDHALACGWDTSIHEKEVTASGRPARVHALSFWRGHGDDTERIYRAWVDGRHHDDGSPPIAELIEMVSSPRAHATRPAEQAAAATGEARQPAPWLDEILGTAADMSPDTETEIRRAAAYHFQLYGEALGEAWGVYAARQAAKAVLVRAAADSDPGVQAANRAEWQALERANRLHAAAGPDGQAVPGTPEGQAADAADHEFRELHEKYRDVHSAATGRCRAEISQAWREADMNFVGSHRAELEAADPEGYRDILEAFMEGSAEDETARILAEFGTPGKRSIVDFPDRVKPGSPTSGGATLSTPARPGAHDETAAKAAWAGRTADQLVAALARKGWSRDSVRDACRRAASDGTATTMNNAGDLAAFVTFGDTEVDLWDAQIKPVDVATIRHGAQGSVTALGAGSARSRTNRARHDPHRARGRGR